LSARSAPDSRFPSQRRSLGADRERSGRPGGCPPGPPWIRACRTTAPGSSRSEVR
jgi:hypothetical protein